jgi:lipopolysaccharide/colanic/teichoic acid biosynthesis glycosyltransferase
MMTQQTPTPEPTPFPSRRTQPEKDAVLTTPVWPEVDDIAPSSTLYLQLPDDWYASLKPTFDTLTGIGMLLISFPFMLLAWAVTRMTSSGPGFYVQTRSGLKHKPYSIIKIRSMHHSKAVANNTNWANPTGDARVTRIGKILRALHLDELPQLFNVMRGEMSLVGPRPERPEVIAKKQLESLVPGYELRLAIKPGVTGLAQVQLPADTDVLSVRHKVYYDLYYLANQSFWLDARICVATILKSFLSPYALQKVLFLPSREEVCAHFLALLVSPDAPPATQPVTAS